MQVCRDTGDGDVTGHGALAVGVDLDGIKKGIGKCVDEQASHSQTMSSHGTPQGSRSSTQNSLNGRTSTSDSAFPNALLPKWT